MLELHRLLVGSYRKHVKTAGGIETLRSLVFLRMQKVTSRIPDVMLLEGIYAGGGVPLSGSPHGLDFNENDCLPVTGDNI